MPHGPTHCLHYAFEDIAATLQLGNRSLVLPHTDMVQVQVRGCGFNSMMQKDKASVASYRHELSVADGQGSRVA